MFEVLDKQRKFFNEYKTREIGFRIESLKKIKMQISKHYQSLCDAFIKDLNKNEYDVVSTEIGLVMNELNYLIKNLKQLAKPKRVGASIINFPAKGYKCYDPYGVVLVAAPWNYPFQLTMLPVIGAIAGGNTVVVKPSRNTPNVTKVIKEMLSIFKDEYIYVITNEDEIQALFDQKFDFIFYTGSPKKARELMEKQGKYLTPMILELGGKSPCIIDRDANLEASARRVAWGKFLNAGQTCVAPDYCLVHESIKDAWIEYVKIYINEFFYEDGKLSKDFVKIINQRSLDRIVGLLEQDKIVFGGNVINQTLEPTIMDNVKFEDKIMQEEIFGPIMPILTFNNLDKEIERLLTKEKPLALYYFGKNKKSIRKVQNLCQFGGGCINDTIMHLCAEKLPFGGVGNSGMGNYHGKQTFYAFTHEKSVLHKAYKTELKLKYPPISKSKFKATKWIFKIK